MVLGQIFSQQSIVLDLKSTDKDSLFTELVGTLAGDYSQATIDEALSALKEREAKMTTGIMKSVAIPHAVCPSLKNTVGIIGISQKGIEYQSLDGSPVHVVFMLLVSPNELEHHVQVMKHLALALQTPDFIDKILNCKSTSEIFDLLCKTDEAVN